MFKKLYDYRNATDAEEPKQYRDNIMSRYVTEVLGKYEDTLTEQEMIRIYGALDDAIIDKYTSLKEKNLFDSVSIVIKKRNIADEDDIKLLFADYDDYVLSIIRSIYQDFEKPNNIVYKNGKKEIKLSSLRNSAYKFEKFPEKYNIVLKFCKL